MDSVELKLKPITLAKNDTLGYNCAGKLKLRFCEKPIESFLSYKKLLCLHSFKT